MHTGLIGIDLASVSTICRLNMITMMPLFYFHPCFILYYTILFTSVIILSMLSFKYLLCMFVIFIENFQVIFRKMR